MEFRRRRTLPPITPTLTPAQRRRIAGLGVASPFQLWNWSAEIGAPAGAMDAWRSFSIVEEIGALSAPIRVTLCNDATSACAAEFFFGDAWRHRDFLYFFLGAFVGGGLVLDGALYTGRTGNAAALGSMPIAPRGARRRDLAIDRARLDLSARAAPRGGGARPLLDLAHARALGTISDPMLERWIEEAAFALAYAVDRGDLGASTSRRS